MENEKKPNFELSKFIGNLTEKWKDNPCPMCKSQSWTVSDKIFEMREFNGGNLVIGSGSIYPVIPVTCNNCGNSIMVNAVTSGAYGKTISDTSKIEGK